MEEICPDCFTDVKTYAFLSPYDATWDLARQCDCRKIDSPISWSLDKPPFYPIVKPTDFPPNIRVHPSVADAIVMLEDYFDSMNEYDG